MKQIVVLCSALLLACISTQTSARPTSGVSAATLRGEVTRAQSTTLSLYKWFHANPELSNKEVKTAKRLAAELRKLGMEVHEGVGNTGVVGIMRGAKPGKGPVVLYRADMDGLPVTEDTGVAYASKNTGVMHACGHDVHMATALGVLRVMHRLRKRWRGAILFVGQPAEEIGRGALQMLGDKRFQAILRKLGTPKVALALHDAANIPAGSVSLLPGYAHANVDSVDIIVHGIGGHGARPHKSIDPVVIGAHIVTALQTIVSRRFPAGTPAVVTVGKFQSGTKHNIIPSRAELLLTVRSYSAAVRAKLLAEIKRIAVNVARAHNAPKPPTVTIKDEFTPAAFNHIRYTNRLSKLFARTIGKTNVKRHKPSLGGEDFGRFARTLKIPGVQYKLGGVDPATWRSTKDKSKLPGLHSALWAPAAKLTLRTGVTTMAAAILDALGS